ncbi:MAG TPA: peptidase, partial [Actinomycetes bacterium]
MVGAAGAGQVGFAGPLAGRGVVVVVHGALPTTYEPVTATVSVGDQVAAGEPIGVLEPAVVHCDGRACLHWGLLRGTTYLDPLTLLGPTRVRLLPFSTAGSGAATPGGGAPPVARGGPDLVAPGGDPSGDPSGGPSGGPTADDACHSPAAGGRGRRAGRECSGSGAAPAGP